MKYKFILYFFCVLFCFTSCTNNKKKQKPVYYATEDLTESVVKVPYTELGGVKTIPVKVNGVTLDMIYDTGCSGLHLSLTELQVLIKNGALNEDDLLGSTYSTIADGSIVQNGLINVRNIEIGGPDGIVLNNVKASVALNQEAPVLLGNGVMDRVAEASVDNINKTINFTRR